MSREVNRGTCPVSGARGRAEFLRPRFVADAVVTHADAPDEWANEFLALDQWLFEGLERAHCKAKAESLGCVVDARWNAARLINSIGAAIYESAALVEGTQATLPYKISPVLSESHPGESFGTVCEAISSHRQSLKKGPYCRFGCGKVVKKDSQGTMWTNYLSWYLYLFRKSCEGFSPACRRSMPGRVSNHNALGHKKKMHTCSGNTL